MSYFSEFPENQYLMLCLCAHCDSFMLVHLEKDTFHKYRCGKCGEYNDCTDIQVVWSVPFYHLITNN